MNERILDKVKNLMQLAQSDNQAEAELAAQRASEILTKYNLSMQDVMKDRTYMRQDIDTGSGRSNLLDDYALQIINNYFFVQVVNQPGSVKYKYNRKVHILGTKSNVEVAIYTYVFIRTKFNALWLQYKRDTGAKQSARGSYLYGLYKGLRNKLYDTRQEVQQETGLIVVDDKDLASYVDQEFGQLKSSRMRHRTRDSSAVRAGYNAGRNMNINKGMTSTSKGRLK